MTPEMWKTLSIFLGGIVFGYTGLGALGIALAAFIAGFVVAANAAVPMNGTPPSRCGRQ